MNLSSMPRIERLYVPNIFLFLIIPPHQMAYRSIVEYSKVSGSKLPSGTYPALGPFPFQVFDIYSITSPKIRVTFYGVIFVEYEV